MSLRKRTTGFTLIELLVVIAIIAILAAILFPVFAKAREKAMQTTCLSNVKEILLAFHMYIGDWDGFFPETTQTRNGGVVDGRSIAPSLEFGVLPYVENNWEIFVCPLDNSVPGTHSDPPQTAHRLSYQFIETTDSNAWGYCGAFGHGAQHQHSRNIDEFEAPANTMIFAERTGQTVEAPGVGGHFFMLDYQSPHGHENGNYGFVDGHAKAISNQMLCTQYGCTNCTTTNADWACYEVANMYTVEIYGP